MTDWRLRVRAAFDRHGRAVAAALLVFAAAGGWLTYGAYAAPGETTETRTVSEWEATGSFDHGATVAGENPLYPAGTELRNRSTYFARIAPALNGSYAFDYAAAERGNLSVAVDARFVVEAVGEENGTVHWRTARPLANRTATGVAPGETVSVPFSAAVAAAMNRTERIDEHLGGSPGETRAAVRVTVDLAGTVEGERVEKTLRYALPIGFESNSYRVGDGGSTEEFAATAPVPAPRDPGPVRTFGGPALLAVAGVGLAGTVAARRRAGPLSPTERARLAFRRDRAAFDEWIVAISLPDAAFDRPRAEASSLADLAEFAIDSGASVIESPADGAYYVLRDGVVYVYDPPAGAGARESPLSPSPATDRSDSGGARDGADGGTSAGDGASESDDRSR